MLLFLITALVPLGMVGVFAIRTAEELIISMISSQLENVADDKVDILERWISERKADLQVVANSSILKSMDPEEIASYLKLVEMNYKVYKGFVVISGDGSFVFNSLGRQTSPVEEEWYKHPMAGGSFISDITLDPEGDESAFRISEPVSGADGEVKGVVCATVGTGTILSIILKVSLGETGECYLVDKNGTFLAHKEPRRILAENISQSESFKNIFGGGHYKRAYIDYRSIEVLGTSRRVSGTDWYLVVEQDKDEAFKGADRLKRYVYIVIVFSTCGAIVLAWLLSYYVVNPIRALSEAANTLARGEFEYALVKTDRKDEIGTLYQAFGSMAVQLEKRQQRLEKKVDLTEAELRETDVKLKETRLAAARSQQLAALGRLAAGVTHEIRTPITSLKLFLESVQAEIKISPEYEEDFKIAMNQVKRIETTINRFLDFARPQEPVFSIIEVHELIEDALLVVKPRANQQETAVDVIMDNTLAKIRGDKRQLGEALLNIMINALEAMSNRGRLIIAASMGQFEIGGEPRKCIRIDFSDTGPGIAQENIASLFDPFFTTKASGTGLGLSIVHSTVASHGGEVRVESVIGKGTTFSVFLPTLTEQDMEGHGKDIDS